MAIWQIESDGREPIRVAGRDWREAAGAALLALGRDPGAARSIVPRIRPDGVTVAELAAADLAFTLREIEVSSVPAPPREQAPHEQDRAHLPHFDVRVAGAAGVEDAAGRALTALDAVVPAESASVLMRRDDKLEFVVARGPAAHKIRNFLLRIDAGIAGHVYTTGDTVMIDDVSGSHVHLHALAEEIGYVPRSVLAVPVVDPEGKRYGVIELLRRSGTFEQTHLAAARLTGQALGAWLAMSPEEYC